MSLLSNLTLLAADAPVGHDMSETWRTLLYLIASIMFIFGVKRLAGVRTAPQGNLLAAGGMAAGFGAANPGMGFGGAGGMGMGAGMGVGAGPGAAGAPVGMGGGFGMAESDSRDVGANGSDVRCSPSESDGP